MRGKLWLFTGQPTGLSRNRFWPDPTLLQVWSRTEGPAPNHESPCFGTNPLEERFMISQSRRSSRSPKDTVPVPIPPSDIATLRRCSVRYSRSYGQLVVIVYPSHFRMFFSLISKIRSAAIGVPLHGLISRFPR